MDNTDLHFDVCLISAGLPSSNPRLVKEAEALGRAGYRVHCVVGDYPTPLRQYDAELIDRAGATATRVDLGPKASYKFRRAVQIGASVLSRIVPLDRVLVRAASPQSLRLLQQAVSVPAKLYIGHTLPALPAAVLAAERRGAVAGFDAEDCHSVETYNPGRNRVAGFVERQFLPRCRHLTASSPQIAEEYRARHGVAMTPILNVFDAPTPMDSDRTSRRGDPLSVYWFSQTIGPGRGLEAIIAGAGRAGADVELCFRGVVSDEYRQKLVTLGAQAGLRRPIRFLEPAHPGAMIEKAGEHDVGLSVELTTPPNHNLALSNKLFTYVAAGIPQIVSRTRAQSELTAKLGKAAILVDLDRTAEIAAAIDFLASEANRREAATEARRLHRERYSWAYESQRLIELVSKVIGGPMLGPSAACSPLRGEEARRVLVSKVANEARGS